MLTRQQILERKTGRGTVTLPGGGEVAVRAVTSAQVYESEKIEADRGRQARDAFLISVGMTDPNLTAQEAEEWMVEAPAGDTSTILHKIAVLSGLAEGADKSSV